VLEALYVSWNDFVGTVEWLVDCRNLITLDFSVRGARRGAGRSRVFLPRAAVLPLHGAARD
jgi:hypothetical protein